MHIYLYVCVCVYLRAYEHMLLNRQWRPMPPSTPCRQYRLAQAPPGVRAQQRARSPALTLLSWRCLVLLEQIAIGLWSFAWSWLSFGTSNMLDPLTCRSSKLLPGGVHAGEKRDENEWVEERKRERACTCTWSSVLVVFDRPCQGAFRLLCDTVCMQKCMFGPQHLTQKTDKDRQTDTHTHTHTHAHHNTQSHTPTPADCSIRDKKHDCMHPWFPFLDIQ